MIRFIREELQSVSICFKVCGGEMNRTKSNPKPNDTGAVVLFIVLTLVSIFGRFVVDIGI